MISHRTATEATELRALRIGLWGNVFMGIAGIVAAWLSNSNALLVDGLFSLIGVFSAIAAARITGSARRGPDRDRPMGYAADEAIYQTFRALSLLGLSLFGVSNAALNISRHFAGAPARDIDVGVIIIYSALVCAVCGLLWAIFWWAWRRTGKTSAMLRIEMTSAAFDGAVTLAVGGVLAAAPLIGRTPLAWAVPVLDYVLVIALCLISLAVYWPEFRGGMVELAGVTADPDDLRRVRRIVRPEIAALGAAITDLALIKSGRRYQMIVFVDPAGPVTAAELDTARAAVKRRMAAEVGPTDCVIVPSEHGRELPPVLLQARPVSSRGPG